MKTIILKRLEFVNFKGGTAEFDFTPCKNVFLGENGAGKTRIADAERWVRTGKDTQGNPSHGRGAFSIKNIVDGLPMSKGAHSVKATYDIDGEELTLERIFAEKWTKARGSIQAERYGHKTTYRLDNKGATTKKDFDARIDEVFGGEEFLLSSDLSYFVGLPWQDRRAIISKMAGNINESEIIDSISGLNEMLGILTVEEKADISTQRKREINDELKTLPARIDEQTIIMAKVSGGVSREDAIKNVANWEKIVSSAQKKIDDFQSGDSSEDVEALQLFNSELREATIAFNNVKNDVQALAEERAEKIRNLKKLIVRNENILSENTSEIKILGQKWRDERDNSFEKMGNTCCYCGEIIVCSHCDESAADAEAEFNKQKSAALEKIVASGKKMDESIALIKKQISVSRSELDDLEKIEEPAILSMTESLEMAELKIRINDLKTKELPVKEVPAELTTEIEIAETGLADARSQLSLSTSSQESAKRLNELEFKMKNISAEFDQIEKFLFMLDEYNKKIAEATEGPVNEMFEYVNFRMFNTQENGAVRPACDIIDKQGRDYDGALSDGERIKAGLDIIKTMSRHFQVQVPVFIDRAESVTGLPELDCQTVELRVSDEHKKLIQV